MTSAPRLLLIDNYDSFTYNLVQYLGELGADVHVHRNDVLTLDASQGHDKTDKGLTAHGSETKTYGTTQRNGRPASCNTGGQPLT